MKPYLLDAITRTNTMPLSLLRKHLWKDECGDVFLIFKGCEVYLKTGYTPSSTPPSIGLYVWSDKLYSQLIEKGLILHEQPTDDSFHAVTAHLSNLPLIHSMGQGFVKRPNLRGKYICNLEKRLGHKILPYNPDIPST